MGFLGNSLGDIANAALGQSSGTNLQSFLSKFYSPEGKFVDSIDPKSTFDVYVKFYPTLESEKQSTRAAVINALGTAATGALKTAGNAITGGLLGSFMNSGSVKDAHDKFEYAGQHTFMEYLLEANLVVGGENWFSNQSILPLELSLGPYVQEVTIPQMQLAEGSKANTLLGDFPINGQFIKTDTNDLMMTVINTKASLHERIFYPWMREVTLPYWNYASQPYTTATITVDFSKHNDCRYVFCGCRPKQIMSLQGKQDQTSAENLTRQITFMFDFMLVQSDLKVSESWSDKLLNTTKPILNSAAHALNLG